MKERGFLDRPFRCFYLEQKTASHYPAHCHGFHKLVIVLKGHLTYSIEGVTYVIKEPTVLLLNKHQVHHLRVSGEHSYERLVVYLSEEFMKDIQFNSDGENRLFQKESVNYRSLSGVNNPLLIGLINEMKRLLWHEKNDKAIILKPILQIILYQINRLIENEEPLLLENQIRDERIVQVIKYLNDHIDESILVETLAEMTFLSRYYFMRLFKEETGFSVHKYLTQKRLVKAHDLILNGCHYQEASRAVGFMDYSVFLKAFKSRYKMSPRHYFAQNGRL